ncbi:hypothetical protein BMR05_11755, partial [Methylococcaceae bacterium HT4]
FKLGCFRKLFRAHSLVSGNRYYVIRDDSSIIAFVAGQKSLAESGYKIIGAHTDSPGLRIKPHALHKSGEILRIGVEVYGGPILATFTDRDLSFAGRVSYRTEAGEIKTQLLCFEQSLLRLPNLAIHMNRKVNEDGRGVPTFVKAHFGRPSSSSRQKLNGTD